MADAYSPFEYRLLSRVGLFARFERARRGGFSDIKISTCSSDSVIPMTAGVRVKRNVRWEGYCAVSGTDAVV